MKHLYLSLVLLLTISPSSHAQPSTSQSIGGGTATDGTSAGLSRTEGEESAKSAVSRPGDIVHAEDFGVRCNGVTDDAPAMTRAQAFASAVRKPVMLPAGTCVVGSTVLIKDYAGFVGQGRGSTVIKARFGGSYDVLKSEGADALWGSKKNGGVQYATLKDLTVDGSWVWGGAGSIVRRLALKEAQTGPSASINVKLRDIPQNAVGMAATGQGIQPGTTVVSAIPSAGVVVLSKPTIFALTSGSDGTTTYWPQLNLYPNTATCPNLDICNGVSMYGYRYDFQRLNIINVRGHALRTEWGSGVPSTTPNQHSTVEDIYIQFAGRNGWMAGGTHDGDARQIIVADACQEADNTFSALRTFNGGGSRIWNFHGFHNGFAFTRCAYQADLQSESELVAGHFEGGRKQIRMGTGSRVTMSRVYAPAGDDNKALVDFAGNGAIISDTSFTSDGYARRLTPMASGNFYAVAFGAGTSRNSVQGHFTGFSALSPFLFGDGAGTPDGGFNQVVESLGSVSTGGATDFGGIQAPTSCVNYRQPNTAIIRRASCGNSQINIGKGNSIASSALGGITIGDTSQVSQANGTAIGTQARAQAEGSLAAGGIGITCNGSYSACLGGRYTNAYKRVGYSPFGLGDHTGKSAGNQVGRGILNARLTSGATAVMTADFGAPSMTNMLNLQAGQAARYTVRVTAKVAAQSCAATWSGSVLALNSGGTIVLPSAVPAFSLEHSIGTCFNSVPAPAFSADNTNKAVAITVSGAGTATISYVAEVQMGEAFP
ncbi:glycosyl hydrolase family 28-related protein [Methylorubrum populi]|nr:glycosyl hydrolase family 28-related protein [Methylorubrum populi]